MNKSLKQVTKSHFDKQSLSNDQFDHLENLLTNAEQADTIQQKSELEKPSNNYPIRFKQAFVGVAAMVMLSILTFQFFQTNNDDLALIIAKEVAKNHIKLKPLEISSANFNEVGRYFTELDFSPSPSGYFSKMGLGMLGGRYCSIQSITAAQLRYQDHKGDPITLYEVGYDETIFGPIPRIELNEIPLTHYIDGLEVQIWVEKGLLMASVKD